MILTLPICKCKFSFFLFTFDECASNEETNGNVPLQKISILLKQTGCFSLSSSPPPPLRKLLLEIQVLAHTFLWIFRFLRPPPL